MHRLIRVSQHMVRIVNDENTRLESLGLSRSGLKSSKFAVAVLLESRE